MSNSTAGDILIGGQPYLLSPNGYLVRESPKSAPRIGGATGKDFIHADEWNYWGESDWIGMGQSDWIADGPFSDGYGLDLTTPGQITIAKQLASTQADAANTGGYVAFTDGTTRCWFIGKTNGTAYYSADLAAWTSAANTPAAGQLATSSGTLKGVQYVTTDGGKLYSLSGTAWANVAGEPLATPAYILGSYKGKLWIGYANALYYYDGTAWSTTQFAGFIDGTPIVGAVGNGVLYFITKGPQSRVFLTDTNQLHHVATLGSDFLPKAAVFLETLLLFGHGSDDTNTAGQVWRLETGGVAPIFTYKDFTNDFGIRSAVQDGSVILWGANRKTGIGVYDPSLDIFQDVQMGFYVSSTIDTLTGAVHGITQFQGLRVCGIEGQGIYKQTTPGTYQIRSSKFDGNTKNINKLWGFGELNHSALISGQTAVLKTSKDGTTLDTWGTSSTAGDTTAIIPGPVNYKSPFLQYDVSGTANGSALSIFDISLSNVEMSDNPKRQWELALDLQGGTTDLQQMRDGTFNTRSAAQMMADLAALWNTKTTFQDIDGSLYTVLLKGPSARMSEILKDVSGAGALEDLVAFYRVTIIQLSTTSSAVPPSGYGQAVYA